MAGRSCRSGISRRSIRSYRQSEGTSSVEEGIASRRRHRHLQWEGGEFLSAQRSGCPKEASLDGVARYHSILDLSVRARDSESCFHDGREGVGKGGRLETMHISRSGSRRNPSLAELP